MAEYVYQNVEGMLSELEEMERLELFTKNEIKCIVKRRTAFEYKLQRRIVQEADFLRYIQYELNLDILRKRRKKQRAIQKKVLPGEAVFIKRLHYLFQLALKKFPNDVKLWLQYIDFCKHMGGDQVLGKVFGKMLQAHPNNSSLWIMAAKWEFEDRKDITSARSILQRALRLNPKCPSLWLEYFRLELLHIDKVKKRRKLLGVEDLDKGDIEEPNSSDFMSGKTARIVYKNAIQNIPENVEFRLKFVDVYHLFDACEEGIDQVYQSLSEDFPNSEEAWNALANRSLKQIKMSRNNLSNLSDSEWRDIETGRNKVFEEAVKMLPTEKMWTYYIEASLSDLERYSGAALEEKVDHVLRLFKSANKAKKLSADQHVLWIQTLQRCGKKKEATKICKTSLSVFPHSVSLWQQYFVIKLSDTGAFTRGLLDDVCAALEKVTSDVDILRLWNFWLEQSLVSGLSTETRRVFDQCMSQCSDHEIIAKIKQSYVELVALKDGIKQARKLYKGLCKDTSVSFCFYKTCLALERSQAKPSLKRSRALYEMAVDRCGAQTPDLWLDYIKLELEFGECENVSKIHWRAMKSLRGKNVEEFVTKYTLLHHSM